MKAIAADVFRCYGRVASLLLWVFVCTVLPAQADNFKADNYKPENSDVVLYETTLPIVFINTCTADSATNIIHKDFYIGARMKIISNADGINYGDTLLHPNQTADYDGWIALKYRGHSSFSLSKKKPYNIKPLQTADPDGKKLKAPLMGMPADNDWALLAPYADRSLIRDVLMMELARPYFEYVPRMRHCELILDGTYYGVFILSERITKGKNRLNLADPGDEGDALTGDYMVEIDHHDVLNYYVSEYPTQNAEGQPFSSNNKVYFQYKHPDYDDMVLRHPEQLQYLQSWIDQVEDALYFLSRDSADSNLPLGPSGTLATSGTQESSIFNLQSLIDLQSFIDYQLSQEFAGNVDAYRLSTPLYKRRNSVDPRMKTTLWDFNIAFGNATHGDRTDIWHYDNQYLKETDPYKAPFWWWKLMQNAEYVDQLKQRWATYRHGQYAEENVKGIIDSLVNHLIDCGAVERNYQAHPVWGKDIWPVPNYENTDSYDKEIAYLKDWIARRTEWLDSQLGYNEQKQFTDSRYYYDLLGRPVIKRKSVNRNTNKRLYIIRYSDGTTRKILD